ncbi:MYND domain-containing protein [Histoplasma ohiense]|nr:MYND domain-containing protein [Histoplasma ohiense (nom. inval.)]
MTTCATPAMGRSRSSPRLITPSPAMTAKIPSSAARNAAILPRKSIMRPSAGRRALSPSGRTFRIPRTKLTTSICCC